MNLIMQEGTIILIIAKGLLLLKEPFASKEPVASVDKSQLLPKPFRHLRQSLMSSRSLRQ